MIQGNFPIDVPNKRSSLPIKMYVNDHLYNGLIIEQLMISDYAYCFTLHTMKIGTCDNFRQVIILRGHVS